MKEPFFEVRVRLPADWAEAAEWALIDAGAAGTAQVLTAAARVEVTGYFTQGEPPSAIDLRDRVLAARGWGAPLASDETPEIEIEVRSRPWEDWVTRTQQALGPFDATPRLRIVPPWAVPPESKDGAGRPSPSESGARGLLVIEPGQAFGIGTHPTTRGCLELLERWAEAGACGSVLDIGTGTGILALRAIQLGFRPVIACDDDPIAAIDAGRNARHNRLEGSLRLFAGEVGALRPGGAFDLILANLHLNPLLALAPWFVERLRPGGGLIASGFQASDGAEFYDAMGSRGISPEAAVVTEEWVAAGLRRVT